MEIVAELGAALIFVTPLIVKLTNDIKVLVPKKFIFLIPYVLWQLIALWLFAAFNDYSLAVYLVNGVVFALSSQLSYQSAKKSILKEESVSTIDFSLQQ